MSASYEITRVNGAPDFQVLFAAIPGNFIVFRPEGPGYTIVAASDDFLRVAGLSREHTLNRGLFEVFPVHPEYPHRNDQAAFLASIDYVLTHKQEHEMPNQRYDTIDPATGQYTYRIWHSCNRPVMDAAGRVQYIIHQGKEVTEEIQLRESAKQLRQAARTRQEMLSAIFEQAPMAIGIFRGFDLVCELANSAYLALVGMEKADFVGRPLFASVPHLRASLEPQMQELLRTGQPYPATELEITLFRNGREEQCYFNSIWEPLREADGRVDGIIIIAEEVTAQVLARRRLEHSERQYRNLVEQAIVATAVLEGPDMVVAIANEAMLRLWGRDASVIGSSLNEFMPELADQRYPKLRETVFATGVTYTEESARVYLKKGDQLQEVYLDFSYKALHDATDTITGILVMATDVTARVRAQQQLQQSEQSLRNTILHAPVAICILRGRKFIIEIANDRMIEFWGKTGEQVQQRPLFEAVPEAVDQGYEELLHQVYETGASYTYSELPVTLLRQGKLQMVYINFSYEPLREAGGNITGIMAVASDVTDSVVARRKIEEVVVERTKALAEANQYLQQSNAELAQFAYIASHDLQEPVRKVSTFTQMLEHSLGAVDDRSRNYLKKIMESAGRMQVLIRDVLAYSQLSTGKEIFERVDLGTVIGQIGQDFELLMEQKGAVLQTEGLPVLEAIPVQMAQLFGNLFSNALKFTRQDVPPVITVTAALLTEAERIRHPALSPEATYYHIVVRDNGIGFSQEYADRIFHIFQRLHGRSEFAGTGIGLAICRKVVQNHHGELYATGRKGSGAEFHIILPEVASI